MKCYELLIKYFPIVKWSQEYRISYLKNDLIAGLTVGITLIPQGLAYGALAGLPPQYGLFASLWGPFIYFFLGTSRDLSLGPTAILSLLVATYSQLSGVPNDLTYAVLLALLTGAIQLLLGLSKLGFLANYMSPTVVSGFTSSAAITIIWSQIMTLLGLKNIRSEFFLSIYDVFSHIHKSNVSDLCLGLGCIFVLAMFKVASFYISPKNLLEPTRTKKIIYKTLWFICISANIVVLILAIGASLVLEKYGITKLTFIGPISNSLPEFQLPKFTVTFNSTVVRTTAEVFKEIGSGIPIIALIALVEAMAIGKLFARKGGYKIRSSQEFIAIGLTNVIGSFFQAYPSSGGMSRTAINSQCLSKSQFSGVITGTVIILSLRFLTPYFAYIPKAALASIIILAVMFMTDFKYLIKIWKFNKYDFVTWILTFVLSIAIGVEYGVISGIVFSFLPIILNASQPKFEVKQCSALFIGSYLWFPFCSRLMAMVELTDFDEIKYSILNLRGVYSIDSAVINTIYEMGQDYQKRRKALIIIVDNASILEKLTQLEDEDQRYGMRCFRSQSEAQVYYQSYHSLDWMSENLSLVSDYQEII